MSPLEAASTSHYQRIHVIINPASGRDRPILNTLNAVFEQPDLDWRVSVTKKSGDARRFAEQAVANDVDAVAVYGGDGTVMEVASALVNSDVPIAILPGGTANALALALGIPTDLKAAAALIRGSDSQLRAVDVGQLDQTCFLVAVGIGLPGALAARTDRETKNRLGLLSYAFRSVQITREIETSHYQITLDGQEIESQGVACAIANSGRFGIPGFSLSPTIEMDDGLLDVVVIRGTDVETILSLATSLVRQDTNSLPFPHWQARQVRVVADPPQPVQADGELLETGPITATVVPQAVRFIVPQS